MASRMAVEEQWSFNGERMCTKYSTGKLPSGSLPRNSMVRIIDCLYMTKVC